MARELNNKVVVITGGAAGIGCEIARRYLQRGAKVTIILDIDEIQGQETARNLCTKYGANRAIFMKCDVTTDLETVSKKIFESFKNVDVLVNNAGILNVQSSKNTIDVNIQALIDWSITFWNHMRKEKNGKGGTILNLASIYGYRVDPYLPVYQASKFAVMGFTKSLGHQYNYRRTGVRVIAICPGFTETKPITGFKTWDDEYIAEDFSNFVQKQLWQKVDAVGNVAVEAFERGNSGTAWLIEGGNPIVEV
ncbi:15-hydroxyprostaglandin dehydrogenase [NAD(+)]-like [Danaus plexippus]|uniref:15-hydroxyprostaglandin dehydrogenase [NAD(+)]-like n=1 Tax=Danaus plexippus TaxID=13037 RepID=UPI002AB181A5|nr:15-hydroxyprostaglandin dehydrogenase [NAD(+)]-like [Danaus plexippus]